MKKVDNDWWEGRLTSGKQGMFPRNYVRDNSGGVFKDDDDDGDTSSSSSSSSAGPISRSGVEDIFGADRGSLAYLPVVRHTVASAFAWLPEGPRYVVKIESSATNTKFAGLKKFVTYEITSSLNNKTVSHRYKQFDWLRTQLVEKVGSTHLTATFPNSPTHHVPLCMCVCVCV